MRVIGAHRCILPDVSAHEEGIEIVCEVCYRRFRRHTPVRSAYGDYVSYGDPRWEQQ